jgi:hypothetical protein
LLKLLLLLCSTMMPLSDPLAFRPCQFMDSGRGRG